MSGAKITFLSIAGLVGLIALSFALELGGLQWMRFFAPKHENVRRKVFKETRSYNESKIQDLARYKLQYERTTGSDRDAVASAIRVMFADYNADDMPVELYAFLKEVRGY